MGCVPTNVGNVCAPGDKVRCVPDGNPCTKDVECASEVCLNGVCALKCDIFGGGCPAGQGCLRTGQGTQGLCRPRGSGVPGAPCRAAEDCGNLLCIDMGAGGSRCAVPCNPAGGTRCGAGTACQAFEDIGICVTDPNAPSDPFGGGGGDGADGASSAGDASGGFVGGDGGGSSCGAGTPFAGPWAAGLLALLLLGGCCRRRRLSEAE